MANANDGRDGEDSTTEDAAAEVTQGGVVDCLGVGIPDRPEKDGEEKEGDDEDV